MADFCLVSRRTLTEVEYKIFRFHYLLGADWKFCCQRLKMNKGDFFHYVYEIERQLGRVFAELAPYPLYPVAEYFNGTERLEPQPATQAVLRKNNARKFRLPLSA